MNHETTASPAGDDDTRLHDDAPSEAGVEAFAIDDGMANPPGNGEGDEHAASDHFEDDDTDATVEIEYEGQVYELPRPLKDALLRQADYTRKTMELADQRRALAADRAGIEQAQAMTLDEFHAASRLDEIAEQLAGLAGQDWSGVHLDHPDLAELRSVVGQLVQEQEMLHERLAEHHHYRSAREQQEMARTRAETDQAMVREIQDWSPARRQTLESFAVSLGISDEQIGHASAAEMRILNLAYLGAQQMERQRAAIRGAFRPAAEIGGSAGGPSDPSRMTMVQYRAWRAKQK
jgi:hypothetical protein